MKSIRNRFNNSFSIVKCVLLLFFIQCLSIPSSAADSSNITISFPYNISSDRSFLLSDGMPQHIFLEPLFLIDYSGSNLALETQRPLIPWLGETITQDKANPKIWTLIIRRNALWSDGKPFNAYDVEFSIDLALDLREGHVLPSSDAAHLRQEVETAKAINDFTVIFTLKNPNPRFALENFAAPIHGSFPILPKHIWDGKDPLTFAFYDPKANPPLPIGTGSYKFKQATNDGIIWELDPNWWGAKPGVKFLPLPQPKQVIWKAYKDADAAAADLKSNTLDAGLELTPDQFKDAHAANDKIVGWDPAGPLAWNDPCPRQLEINTQPPTDAGTTDWSNPKLRKALSLLIDRTTFAAKAYGGTTTASTTMFVHYGAMQSFIDAVTHPDPADPKKTFALPAGADTAAAKDLLDQAGYHLQGDKLYHSDKDKSTLAATISVDGDLAQDLAAADELVNELKAAGVDAELKSVPHDEFWGDVLPTGNYQMAYSWLSCGSVVEPYTSMRRYSADKSVPIGDRSPGFDNTGRWDTPAAKAYTAIVEQIRPLQLGDPTVPGLVAKAYGYLDQEMPFIPLVQSPKIIPFNTTNWKGWPTKDDPYTVPMTDWASMQLILHRLQPAK